MKPKIILASASKRRSRILSECGIKHKVVISAVKEIHKPAKGPKYNALTNAYLKANAIAKKYKYGYIIGADTLVSLGKRLIGKPKDRFEAAELLSQFSGKILCVYTGLCVKDVKRNKTAKAVVRSKIKVKKINKKDINKLLKYLGPYDKAGGFSIEGVGSFIFDNVEGSFYNILGLPMIDLYGLFSKLGVELLDAI